VWGVESCKFVFLRGNFLFTYADTYAVSFTFSHNALHSVIDRQTERQTDRRHYHANRRLYCMQHDRLKIMQHGKTSMMTMMMMIMMMIEFKCYKTDYG